VQPGCDNIPGPKQPDKKENPMTSKFQNCLFFMRISIALVLLMWTIDKFVNPAHAIGVYDKFYFIPASLAESIMFGVAVAEMVLIALFVAGRFKNITYLVVLLIHAVSTITPIGVYLDPFKGAGLLFFAAWPMLAACYTLYVFRADDTKFNF
jgi:hypothetical protein